MRATAIHSISRPIAYADQRQRKVFVLSEDRSEIIPPSTLQLKDKHGNVCMVPTRIQGDMTVLDVKQLSAGGYFLQILGKASEAIRIILF